MNDTPQNEAPKPTNPANANPDQQVKATLQRIPAQLQIQGDKIDEVAALMSMCRSPDRYAADAPFAVVHQSMKVVDVEKLMPTPARTRKKITFTDVESFIEYFNAYKADGLPRVFVRTDNDGMKIMAILDFDEAAGLTTQDGRTLTLPRWGEHQVYLEMKFHPDYRTLRNSADTFMSQQDFALFVEENLHLFNEPVGADMLELAQSLKGIRNADWQIGERLANGEQNLKYVETVSAQASRKELAVPEYITLKTPLYEGFDDMIIKAAFRWRLVEKDGKHHIGFAYRLLTKLDERKAQEDVKKEISEKTEMKLLNVASFQNVTYSAEE